MLNASAVQASGRGAELAVRPIVEPELVSVLFLAQSATKPPTPLQRQVVRLLSELIEERPDSARPRR